MARDPIAKPGDTALTTRTIGDPAYRYSSGGATEFHFVSADNVVAIVHSDLIGKRQLTRAMTGTAVISAQMDGPSGCGLVGLPDHGELVVWSIRPDGGRDCMGLFHIDYLLADSNESGEHAFVEGRGPLAPVIDTPLHCEIAGDLGTIIAESCKRMCPVDVSRLSPRRVVFYSNTPSTYASLRLMSISLGSVVHEESDRKMINVISTEILRRDLASQPIPVIRDADITSVRRERGSRIRRREE
jgi:hypothetical protein